MRVLIFGGNGQVGRELVRRAGPRGHSAAAPPRRETDVTDRGQVEHALSRSACDVVVNAAAYTAVDRAESDREGAFAVNAEGAGNVASACAAGNIPLIHISTDYVFDGSKGAPYVEDDRVVPLNAYGASKAEGEAAVRTNLTQHVIVRSSWVFSAHGANFVKTMLRLARERDEIRVVSDQYGSPTAAGDLADALLDIAEQLHQKGRECWGTCHYCGEGETTWHGFAEAIFDELRAREVDMPSPRLVPISTDAYPTPARRPMYSVLDCTRIGTIFGIHRRSWRAGLREAIRELLLEQ